MNQNFHLTPLYQSWSPEDRYSYEERICIMCEQGLVTEDAHEAALADVERRREEMNNSNNSFLGLVNKT
jgi:hypothetical protein